MRESRLFSCFVLGLGAVLACGDARAITSSVSGGVLTVTGDPAGIDETITVSCSAGLVRVNAADPGTGPAACSTITQVVVDAGAGADVVDLSGITVAAFPAGLVTTTLGGLGADVSIGSAFADAVRGGDGNDLALLGAGDDSFTWNPGDDNDTLEGQSGNDVLVFNGSGAIENIDVAANGGRVRFFRDIGAVTMDLDDVERIEFDALGAADTVVVNNLAGTDLVRVDVDLALAGGSGDGQVDQVVLNGTAAANAFSLDAPGGRTQASLAGATVAISNPEPGDRLRIVGLGGNDTFDATPATGSMSVLLEGGAESDTAFVNGTPAGDDLRVASQPLDPAVIGSPTVPEARSGATPLFKQLDVEALRIDGLGGNDTISASGALAGLTLLTFDGGAGDDALAGGTGADTLIGGVGDDVVDGAQGNDVVLLGAGNDRFTWDPGDGSDVVEGGADTDLVRFNGSGANETIAFGSNGTRLRLTRDVGAITMDVDDVESVELLTLGGTDTITVGDIVATDVADLMIDAGVANDSVATRLFAAITQRLAGGDPVTFPGDTLTVANFFGDLRSSPVSASGFAPLSHTQFEFGPAGSGGRVSGTAHVDADLDGTRDPTEAGIAGVRIFDDVDADGAFDPVEPSVLSADDGSYEIVFTADQTVDLRAAAPAGFVARSGPDAIPLAGGTTVGGADFAFLQGTVFEALLTGAQETPPNASSAAGDGMVVLSAAEDSIVAIFEFAGLGSNNTLSHIHAPAPRGTSAAPLFDLPVSGTTSGSFEVGPIAVTPAQVQQLRDGLWYFNVHSVNFPGGEIRGQIDNILFADGFE